MTVKQQEQNLRMILLRNWRKNCFRSQVANYEAGNKFSARNYWLGVPTVIFSAIVGTSIFAALGNEVKGNTQIIVGIISILASTLAALQTFMNWGERASKSRITAAGYGSVKRQIDQLLSVYSKNDIPKEEINAIREQMDTLSKEAPELPKTIWDKIRKTIPTYHDDYTT